MLEAHHLLRPSSIQVMSVEALPEFYRLLGKCTSKHLFCHVLAVTHGSARASPFGPEIGHHGILIIVVREPDASSPLSEEQLKRAEIVPDISHLDMPTRSPFHIHEVN